MSMNNHLTARRVAAITAMLASAALFAVATHNPADQPTRALAGYAVKSTNLAQGATNAYRPWFENGAWQGDLIEYDIDQSGVRTTDVDVGVTPATATGNNWSARATFDGQAADWWTSGRKVITSTTGTNQVAFRWANLTDAQKSALDASENVPEPLFCRTRTSLVSV